MAQQEKQIHYLQKINEVQESAFKKLNEENAAFKKRMSELTLKKHEIQKQITENSTQITTALEIQENLKQEYQKETDLLEKELKALKEVINTSFDKIKEEQKLLLQNKAAKKEIDLDKENLTTIDTKHQPKLSEEVGKATQETKKEEVKVTGGVQGSARAGNPQSNKKAGEDNDKDFDKIFKVDFDADFDGDFKNEFANFDSFDLKPAMLEDSLGIFENEKSFYPQRGRANSRQTPPQQQIDPYTNLSGKSHNTPIEVNPFGDFPGETIKKPAPAKKTEPISSFDQAWDDDPFQGKPAPKKKIDYSAFTTFSSF